MFFCSLTFSKNSPCIGKCLKWLRYRASADWSTIHYTEYTLNTEHWLWNARLSEWVTRPELQRTHLKTCTRLSWSHTEASGSYFTPKSNPKPKNINIVFCHQNKAYNNINCSKNGLHFLYATEYWGERWPGCFFMRFTPSALFTLCHSSVSAEEKDNHGNEEHLRSIFNLINRQYSLTSHKKLAHN